MARRYRAGYQPVSIANIRGGSEDAWSGRGKLMFNLGEATLRLRARAEQQAGKLKAEVWYRLGDAGQFVECGE